MSQQATQSGIDRRDCLKQSSGALLTLSLLHLVPAAPKRAVVAPRAEGEVLPSTVSCQQWQDVYRERWAWDKVVHSSHAPFGRLPLAAHAALCGETHPVHFELAGNLTAPHAESPRDIAEKLARA